MMQDSFLHRDQPWECEGLDPFRDDPVGTNSDFEYNDIHGDKSDDENGEDGDQGARVLVAIVCTCRVWRKDCAARGFRAGKKSINLQVFG